MPAAHSSLTALGLLTWLLATLPAQTTWIKRGSATNPNDRTRSAMTFSPTSGHVFLFGGHVSNIGATDQAWEWTGKTWVLLKPEKSPSPREMPGIATDPDRGRIVVFGGEVSSSTGHTMLGDTWEWDGKNWFQQAPTTSPSARAFVNMAYDEKRQRVVLFGGSTLWLSQPVSDTWEWDGKNWTKLSPQNSPLARSSHGMAYDAVRGRVVLFGGWTGKAALGDTWEWDGSDWTKQSPATAPSARYLHGLVYDRARARTVLFDGISGSTIPDTWEWDGKNWTKVDVLTSPSARQEHTMAYDERRGRIVLFGGSSAGGSPLGETWELATSGEYTPFGQGCASSATPPALKHLTMPRVGQEFVLEASNMLPSQFGVLVFGASDKAWGNQQLPLNLGFMGMSSCQLLVSWDELLPLWSETGTLTWKAKVPKTTTVVGLNFYNQVWVADPSANAAGIATSNGGKGVIGGNSSLPNVSHELAFSTYLGGKNWEHARDVCTDAAGNIYMVGGTSSPDFPTTPEASDRSFGGGGSELGSFGACDAFVAKFSAEGRLLWSTFVGGPNYDRAYGVEVGTDGFVYIAGRAGPGFPVTTGAFQVNYGGTRYNAPYGSQNGFVAKLRPDGKGIVWASYVGVGELCRDIAIDAVGDIYVPLGWNTKSGSVTPPAWMAKAMAGAFQKKPAGNLDCGVVKIRGDGSAVVWATWLGGSSQDTQEASIRVDAKKRVVIAFNTQSDDLPTTDGAASRKRSGGTDGYVAMFEDGGGSLVYATYLGGSKNDYAISTHNLALDSQGLAYLAMGTESPDFPLTSGTLRPRPAGGWDCAVVKLSAKGAVLQSTILGGTSNDEADGISVDPNGSVLVTGATTSLDFPTTTKCFQTQHGGDHDAFVALLSPDFSRLVYSTLMGGTAFDTGRSSCLGPNGELIVTGSANGAGWPARNAHQSTFAGTNDGRWGNGDCVLARFRRSSPGKSQ